MARAVVEVLFAMRGVDTHAWLSALKERLPTARVRVWQPGDVSPADYVLYWKESVDALAPRDGVRAVFNMGAGVDALIDLLNQNRETVAHTVPVVRLEDAGMAPQMVQYAIYCALRYQRRFDEYEVQAADKRWQPLEAYPIESFTIGVLGAGKLGLPVAQALVALGFPVRLYSRTPKEVEGIASYAGAERFGAFVAGVRMLINLLPNTPETEGLLSKCVFDAMASGGFVVNLARGSHVVDQDLLDALDDGRLRRAALDVFRNEPLGSTHPFWKHPGVEVTPHISARTLIDESVKQVAEKILRNMEGGPLPGIDLARGY